MGDESIRDWAAGHGLPVDVVDGNDVEVVSDAARAAVPTPEQVAAAATGLLQGPAKAETIPN
jgi:TPP-dependent pyruvate/acetoin dehydrogenase alpha subunit